MESVFSIVMWYPPCVFMSSVLCTACVWVHIASFHKDTSQIGPGRTLLHDGVFSPSVCSDTISKEAHILRPSGRILTHSGFLWGFFGGHSSIHISTFLHLLALSFFKHKMKIIIDVLEMNISWHRKVFEMGRSDGQEVSEQNTCPGGCVWGCTEPF